MIQFAFTRRMICFLGGTMSLGFGVAISTSAGLGTSPISSVPYVLTYLLPLSFGVCTFVFNLLFVFGQILLLRRNYSWIQLGQLAAVFLLGLFIDLGMYVSGQFTPANYALQLLELFSGSFLIALGVALQLIADVTYVPGEGFIRAFSSKFKFDFGLVKLTTDTTLVILAGALSLCFLIGLTGLREGTLIAAVCIGPMIRLLLPRLRFVKKMLLIRL